MKNFNDTIGNRTGNLPVCRIHPKNVSQITEPFSENYCADSKIELI